MKYRLVIFDFDGTLADSFPWFVGTLNAVADKFKFKRIEEGAIERLREQGSGQALRRSFLENAPYCKSS